MPKLEVPEDVSVARQRTAPEQVNISVTPEQIAGPEVRLLQQLGKDADEITDFVIRKQNALDLDTVNRADTAMKELLMEDKLHAEKLQGMDASGLLTKSTAYFDGNFQPAEDQPITEAHQRYLDIYERADERQQAAIDYQRGKQRILHLKAIGSYEQQQTFQAVLDGHKANIEISVAKGINGTEEEAAFEISSIISQYNSIQALTGAEPNTITADQMKDISSIHMGRLDNLINAKDITGAEEYFKKHKNEMVGDTSTMEKSIASSKEDILAEEVADEATRLRLAGKWNEARHLIDSQPPEIQSKAWTQFDTDIKEEETQRKHREYGVKQKANESVYLKTQQGEFVFKKYSDLPIQLRNAIEEIPGLKDIWRKEMSTRGDPIPPSKLSQAARVSQLTKLQFGTREEKLRFATESLFGLDGDNKKSFIKAQQEILNPTPEGTGKTNYLASAIKRSNFDSTNEGHMEVQGQLVMEVITAVAHGEGKTDTKAAGDLTFDEYKGIVDKYFNPGKVTTMKAANSRPKIVKDKGKTFGTPKDIAKNYLDIRGSDNTNMLTTEKYEATWINSVRKYNDAYYQEHGEYPGNRNIERYMQFAEKNVVQYEDDDWAGFGDRTIILAQIPEGERDARAYVEINNEKITHGQVNGADLKEEPKRRLLAQIKEYLNENNLPNYLKNKAKAYHAIQNAEERAKAEARRVRQKNKMLAGETARGENKKQIYDSAMKSPLNVLKKYRDENWGDMAPDELAIFDLVINEKTKGRGITGVGRNE